MIEVRIKKKDLCPCDPLPHIHHQLCQGCKRKVPVPYQVTAFCNSTWSCDKCPEGRKWFSEVKVILED